MTASHSRCTDYRAMKDPFTGEESHSSSVICD